MGGKNKQRTKGNVRPSSSGRAAELLARENGVVPGFVGFGTTATPEPGYVPAVHGAEDIDSLVDADFRLVLRKLSKRDAFTRLKAVQEFGSMCQEREAEVVKGVLPYWPRIYCKISVDHDRRVREATQQAFEQLVLKVRRSLAPFLKSLMGHWMLAQCDTYTPAASAACQVFHAAFPPSKQPEALSFCREEILNVLQDTLLKETADTLSDPQSVPEEEREAKFLRMVTSSLLGVKRLLSLLPSSDRTALEERLAHLIAAGKFWKYGKHKTPQIRGAFFEVLSALCEYTPSLVQNEAARACPAVLLSIDDTDPVVLPPLWEAVLHIVSTIPDFWTHINSRKGFLPKLWGLLKEGGKGMATVLHPNLMPLISKLPQEITDPALDFYTNFFTSLIQGLSSERAVTSPSESAAIVTAAVECLRYSILHNTAEGEDQRQIRIMLISQQLLPLLDRALGNPSLQNGPFFLLVTEMLISWENRAGLHGWSGSNGSEDVFQKLLEDFWEGLNLLFVRYTDNEEADPKALEGVATLLQVSVSTGNLRKQGQRKKSVKICFSKLEDKEESGVEGGGGEKPDLSVPALEPEKAIGSLKTEHLEDVVCQQAQLCLVYVNEKNSEKHLLFLSLLLRSFHTHRVFAVSHTLVEMDDKITKEGEQREEMDTLKNPAMRFLLERVVVWLAEKGRTDTDHLVEMVFSSLHCCSQQETIRILNHIATMDLQWGIILQIIQRASADPETLKSCGDWLKGSVLGEQLLGLADELCNLRGSYSTSTSPKSTHSWTLISLVLSQRHNNEPLIGEVYMEKILEKLHATLCETKGLSDAGNIEPLVSFICNVASTFFSSVQDCLLLTSAEELLLTVFQLTAQDQTHTHLSGCHNLIHLGETLKNCNLRKKKKSPPLIDSAHCQFCIYCPNHFICVYVCLCFPVAELLYALQWCQEMECSPATVSAYHRLLNDWGLSKGLHSQVPVKDLFIKGEIHLELQTVYIFPGNNLKVFSFDKLCIISLLYRSVEEGGLWSLTLENYIQTNNLAATDSTTITNLYRSADRSVFDFITSLIIVLKKEIFWRNSKEDWFLFSSNLSKVSAAQLMLTVEMMRFLSWLVTNSPTVLSSGQWDFLLCSMLAWLETASENVSNLWNPWVQLFVCENTALIVKLNQFFTSPSSAVLEKLPPELSGEWTDFFIEGIYSLLLPLPIKITDDPLFPLAVLQSVGVALTYVPVQQLSQNSLPARFIADQKTNLPEPLQTLLNTLCPLLLFKARPLQITAYHLLDKVMPQLPECDGEGDNSKSDDDAEEPCLSPPAPLMSILSACEELCESILAGVQVGEFAVVQPLSVEYSCILGYLLAWKLLLTFFKSSPSHLRVQYSLYLKRSRSLHNLLLHLFKMMPENPVYPGQGGETKETRTLFTESLSLAVDKSEGVQWELLHLACSVYYSAVQDLPAMVRLWWNSQEKRVCTTVEKFTTKYVSPVLSAQEISSVHSSTQTFDSMTVKARSVAREVIATYSVDDIFIELVIQLPQNYPLGSITVESGRRVGVSVQQWRNWMLQLSTYLTHQNGSIMEGLALWKNNVDKRFEGVEDCMICFSVIHGSNYSLPKKACRTCKKKFHSACLYKWFTSSNKSTCPLCRETFF
uniref:E3 ubiquitin-protein ligase listerin n=1 Tax=Myripristis murdjan TaxID=586833 RepID=A0A667XXH2_9TELE